MADNPAIITSAMPMKPDRLMCSRQKISPQIVEKNNRAVLQRGGDTGCPEPNARHAQLCNHAKTADAQQCEYGLPRRSQVRSEAESVMPMRPVAVMLMENSITVRHSGSPS